MVDYQAPNWPQSNPVELYWGNLKWDYRSLDLGDKTADVGGAVRAFAAAVTVADVEGWVLHTDDFCRSVVARDPEAIVSSTSRSPTGDCPVVNWGCARTSKVARA